MTRAIIMLMAAALASPVAAQHDHSPAPPPRTSPPATSCTPEHAAMGHCTLDAPAPKPPEPTPSCTAEHAAMGHCTMPAPAAAPAAVPCTPEHAAMGHCRMPSAQPAPSPPPAETCTPEHAAMGHCRLPDDAGIAETPPPREAFAGPAHAQDLYFDPAAAARSRAELAEEHGGLEAYRFLVERLEASIGEGRDGYAWDAQIWYGGDIDKFWLKTEGEGEFGGNLEEVEAQALWSHAINPWFDLQAGVRQDLRSGPDRTHLALGIQGLAPYWFEVEGALFLSNEGELTARAEAEYDLRLTQSLILQPRAEMGISFQDVPELGLGSGISTAELGARLRYELFPHTGPAVVAPYIGAQYERAFGDTATFRRASGEDIGGWRFLVGVRTWF